MFVKSLAAGAARLNTRARSRTGRRSAGAPGLTVRVAADRSVVDPIEIGPPGESWLALGSPAASDKRNQPAANAIEWHDLLGGLIHEYRAAA